VDQGAGIGVIPTVDQVAEADARVRDELDGIGVALNHLLRARLVLARAGRTSESATVHALIAQLEDAADEEHSG